MDILFACVVAAALGISLFQIFRVLSGSFSKRRPEESLPTPACPSAILPDPLPQQPRGTGCGLFFVLAGLVFLFVVTRGRVFGPFRWQGHAWAYLATFGAMTLWTFILTYALLSPRKRKPPNPQFYVYALLAPLVLLSVLMIAKGAVLLAVPWFMGLVLGRQAAIYALIFRLSSDRHLAEIHKRALEFGDLDGAIAELRAEIDAGQTANWQYHSLLGLLLADQERWDEAYKEFLATQDLVSGSADVSANVALALWKLGRTDEALATLVEMKRSYPHNLSVALTLGRVLADLGRLDEARAWLARSELLLSKLKVRGPGSEFYRRRKQQALESLKAEIDTKAATMKPKTDDLAEL